MLRRRSPPEIFGVLGHDIVTACTAEVDSESHESICGEWAHKIGAVLANPREAFNRAEEMRSHLRKVLNWEIAATRLSADLLQALQQSPAH